MRVAAVKDAAPGGKDVTSGRSWPLEAPGQDRSGPSLDQHGRQDDQRGSQDECIYLEESSQCSQSGLVKLQNEVASFTPS